MDKSILLQKQVRDNSEDLQSEFLDMKSWEEQMKRKDEELKKEASGEAVLPPIRTKTKKKGGTTGIKPTESKIQPKRIKSYDYSSWEKFDVEKACKDVDKEEQSDDSGDEHLSKEELERAHDEATKHKNEGNSFVQQRQWVKAIGSYNLAIKKFPYDAVFYANRALCHLKLENLHSAEADCSTAIQLDESYVKAYHRRATARMDLKQYKEARQDVEKILKLEPGNKEAKTLLTQIEKKIERSKPVIISGENLDKGESIEKKIGEKLCGNSKTSTEKRSIQMKPEKKSEQPNEKDQKKKEDIKMMRIPDWLPEKNDVAIVEPLEKPAHQRSKGLGRRVPVEETNFDTVKSALEGVKISCKENNNKKTKEAIETNISQSNLAKTNSLVKSVELSETSCKIPSAPKTAAQFLIEWRRNKSQDFRYKYLKQMPAQSLPKVFQESMESDVFTDILEVLRTQFMPKSELVFDYVENLTRVKRFKTLVMFMSNKDREGLRTLFEYCKTNENIAEENVEHLYKEYEV